MSVYVRIPRRPSSGGGTTYSWTRWLPLYTWTQGTCWYEDNRVAVYFWDQYNVVWSGDTYHWDVYDVVWTPTKYNWQRYNVIYGDTQYIWRKYDVVWMPTTYYWEKWSITLDGNSPAKLEQVDEVMSTDPNAYPQDGYNSADNHWYVFIESLEGYPQKMDYLNDVTTTNVSDYEEGYNTDGYWYEYGGFIEPTASKGSYVDYITSVQADTYPKDGVSGSYWYVYTGYTEGYYTKDLKVGTYDGKERNEKPDDGLGDDYMWYVYTGMTESTPSRGDLVSSGWSSLASDTYPADGIHTDGYWYTYTGADIHGSGSWQYSPHSEVTSYERNTYPDSFTEYTPEIGSMDMQEYWEFKSTTQGGLGGETFTSTDPNAYPSNGLHTDGYWYVSV